MHAEQFVYIEHGSVLRHVEVQVPLNKVYPSLQPVQEVPAQIAQFGSVDKLTEQVIHEFDETDPLSEVEPAGQGMHVVAELAPTVEDHVPALQLMGYAYP
jgi:hypothetical protein